MRRLAGGILALGIISCGFRSQQSQRGGVAVVQGVVVDDSTGRGLEDALVILATEPLRMVTTDSAGRFRFDSVAGGRYTVEASAIGYVTADSVWVVVRPSLARAEVDTIRLVKGVWHRVEF